MFFILLYVKVHIKDLKIYVIVRSFEVYLKDFLMLKKCVTMFNECF